jgi:hypothetical protein
MILIVVAAASAAAGVIFGMWAERRSIAANDARVKQTICDLGAAIAQGISIDQKETTP